MSKRSNRVLGGLALNPNRSAPIELLAAANAGLAREAHDLL